MRKLVTAVLLASVLMFVCAGVASAATSPQGIYDDYATNGTLTGVYTIEELQAYLNNAPVMQLAGPTVLTGLNNLVTKAVGLMKQGKSFPDALNEATQGRPMFPWTGVELAVLLLCGAGLVGTGTILRRRAS